MKQRVITGVIAGAAFIGLTMVGALPFTILVLLLALIGLYELLAMKKKSIFSIHGIISSLLLVLLIIPSEYFAQIALINDLNNEKFSMIVVGSILLLVVTVTSKNKFNIEDAAISILGLLYIGYGFHAFLTVRLSENGLSLLFFVLFLIWATDSGAYFVGKALGKTKLWPSISPNKTIEGALGGIGAAVIVALIFHFINPLFDTIGYAIFIAIFVGIFGQLGDLVQSAYKRHYGVKDSGNLLPGHGGILDRFDSTIFVFPLLVVLQLI